MYLYIGSWSKWNVHRQKRRAYLRNETIEYPKVLMPSQTSRHARLFIRQVLQKGKFNRSVYCLSIYGRPPLVTPSTGKTQERGEKKMGNSKTSQQHDV